MGMMDKMKFWKRDDDFGDMGNLDDFSLDDNPGAQSNSSDPSTPPTNSGIPPDADPAAMGDLPKWNDSSVPGLHEGVPTMREDFQPSEKSQQMSSEFGLDNPGQMDNSVPHPATARQQNFQQNNQSMSQPQSPQTNAPQHLQAQVSSNDLSELFRNVELMHAKIDAIRSSLDSINQRLATLERVASGDNKNKYSW